MQGVTLALIMGLLGGLLPAVLAAQHHQRTARTVSSVSWPGSTYLRYDAVMHWNTNVPTLAYS